MTLAEAQVENTMQHSHNGQPVRHRLRAQAGHAVPHESKHTVRTLTQGLEWRGSSPAPISQQPTISSPGPVT
jgi:hypothetical protein